MSLNFKNYFKCFIIIVITLTIYSCKSTEEQSLCLKNYIDQINETPEYSLIRRSAKDTITKWATMNLRSMGDLKKIDSAVFFNEDKSKAILLLLKIDPKKDAVFDYVKMIAAEMKEGHWYFYSASLPLIAFDRSENLNHNPYTFKELSELGQKGIISRGYYDKGTCKIDYNYVNNWFKHPLAEYHEEYLHTRVEE